MTHVLEKVLIFLLLGVGLWKMSMGVMLLVSRIKDSTQNGVTLYMSTTYIISAVNTVWIATVLYGTITLMDLTHNPALNTLLIIGIGVNMATAFSITLLTWNLESDRIRRVVRRWLRDSPDQDQ